MNYLNIDLNSPYEREHPILHPYSMETLLLEIHCNIKDITKQSIVDQYTHEIDMKAREAKEIFAANLNNIYLQAIKERKS